MSPYEIISDFPMVKVTKEIISDILSSPIKFFWNSVGAVIGMLLLGKNFLEMSIRDSVKFGFVIYLSIIGLYLGIKILVEVYNLIRLKWIESDWGAAIVILKDAYADIHFLRKSEYGDEELIATLQQLCDKLKLIFDKKTGADCGVSIKVPIQVTQAPETFEFRNLCRDSKHRQRDTEQYGHIRHTVIGNTPYTNIINSIISNSESLAYVNNNIQKTEDYHNTSIDCYPDKKLPYNSEIVYPIVPVKNEGGRYAMCGFICIDCPNTGAFIKNGGYEVPMIQGVADGIYDLILKRINQRNNERNE